jgi:hypothetical protein
MRKHLAQMVLAKPIAVLVDGLLPLIEEVGLVYSYYKERLLSFNYQQLQKGHVYLQLSLSTLPKCLVH